jgi:ABC-2 type transport system ATP-binding protein
MSDAAPAIAFESVSRWFGDTVALADVSFTADGGVIGLLGHNGAGKSTTLKLCAGFSTPSSGIVRIFGTNPRRTPDVYRRVGIVPDHSPPWPFLTARRVVELSAELHRVADYRAAAAAALETVGLEDAADRPVGGFSHGMRQRVKLAQALAHDPELLLLDEPLNGLDPTQRSHVIELLTRLGREGRTVIVSSHVLHEVERMAPRVLVLVNGHLVAEGATDAIRRLISERPRRVLVQPDRDGRSLARELLALADVDAVRLQNGTIEIETSDPAALSHELPHAARRTDTLLRGIQPVGDDLESVYAYLHERARGQAR